MRLKWLFAPLAISIGLGCGDSPGEDETAGELHDRLRGHPEGLLVVHDHHAHRHRFSSKEERGTGDGGRQ